jgi:hypothetical protein
MKKIALAATNSKVIDTSYRVYLYNDSYSDEFINGEVRLQVVHSHQELRQGHNLLLGVFCNGMQIGLIAVHIGSNALTLYPFVFVVKVFDKKHGVDYPLVPYALVLQDRLVGVDKYFDMTFGEAARIELKPVREYILADIEMVYPSYIREAPLPSPRDERRRKEFWELEEVKIRKGKINEE